MATLASLDSGNTSVYPQAQLLNWVYLNLTGTAGGGGDAAAVAAAAAQGLTGGGGGGGGGAAQPHQQSSSGLNQSNSGQSGNQGTLSLFTDPWSNPPNTGGQQNQNVLSGLNGINQLQLAVSKNIIF